MGSKSPHLFTQGKCKLLTGHIQASGFPITIIVRFDYVELLLKQVQPNILPF